MLNRESSALVYLAVPKFVLPDFGNFDKTSSGIKCKKEHIFKVMGKVAPGRVRVGDAN
jgi:hypothetical protein